MFYYGRTYVEPLLCNRWVCSVNKVEICKNLSNLKILINDKIAKILLPLLQYGNL